MISSPKQNQKQKSNLGPNPQFPSALIADSEIDEKYLRESDVP